MYASVCAGVYFWGRNEGWDKKRPMNTGELTPNTIPYPTVLVHRRENPRQPHQLLSMKHSDCESFLCGTFRCPFLSGKLLLLTGREQGLPAPELVSLLEALPALR